MMVGRLVKGAGEKTWTTQAQAKGEGAAEEQGVVVVVVFVWSVVVL